ncbi:hypothetical protein CCR75_009207 [Bremia lactucae]|uniref:RxLR effector protein n=1 Tax=Bremia lactucae TaxID=4779 RepID=A0A976IHV6_BRELC|nr:hypothetical protein CCR75_009207 [Bremia lactucae]
MATLLACITSGSPVASEPYAPGLVSVAPRLRGTPAATTNGDTENRIFWKIKKTTAEKLASNLEKKRKFVNDLERVPKSAKYLQIIEQRDAIRNMIGQKVDTRARIVGKLDKTADKFLVSKDIRELSKISDDIIALQKRKFDLEKSLTPADKSVQLPSKEYLIDVLRTKYKDGDLYRIIEKGRTDPDTKKMADELERKLAQRLAHEKDFPSTGLKKLFFLDETEASVLFRNGVQDEDVANLIKERLNFWVNVLEMNHRYTLSKDKNFIMKAIRSAYPDLNSLLEALKRLPAGNVLENEIFRTLSNRKNKMLEVKRIVKKFKEDDSVVSSFKRRVEAIQYIPPPVYNV